MQHDAFLAQGDAERRVAVIVGWAARDPLPLPALTHRLQLAEQLGQLDGGGLALRGTLRIAAETLDRRLVTADQVQVIAALIGGARLPAALAIDDVGHRGGTVDGLL